MGRDRTGLGYIAANEATGDTGVELTRTWERLCREDEERALYLDEQIAEQRIVTRRVRAAMRLATYRKRRPVPA